MTPSQKENRISELLKQVIKFSKSDLKPKIVISQMGDDADKIAIELNKLGAELNTKKEKIEREKARIDVLLDILIKYTSMNFSEKAPITENRDELDAFAAGINALVEELDVHIHKIKEGEERFRLLIENVKDYSICMLNIEGNIISWNKGAEKIQGYSEKEIMGKHFSIFYPPEDLIKNEPEKNLKSVQKYGRFESEGWRVKKNGSRFWANVIFTPLYNSKGNIQGFSKITRDITERKNAELKLLEKSEELVRSNAELEQFAYVASHDLQEPLRMITSYLQLLEKRYKDNLDDDAKEFINYAVDGSNRMRVLINSLLEYSRVNRHKPFEKVNITEQLEDVIQNLKEQIEKNDAIIKISSLPEVVGDTVLINQLFQNLISNAIKYRSENRPEIIISGEKMQEKYLFSIRDNGIGIKKEYAQKVFVIFQRLHSKEKYPGTGIGLAICKKIVERHGGKIWLESEIGKGTTFYFTIKKHR
jgi:PAS domain S-box-containing protein